MVNYSLFSKTDNVAYNILTTLEFCKQNNEDGLVYEKGVYNVFSGKALQGIYSISNHSHLLSKFLQEKKLKKKDIITVK